MMPNRHSNEERTVDFEELLPFPQTRRTIRAIKSDPIPDQAVEKILEAARWAPTGFTCSLSN